MKRYLNNIIGLAVISVLILSMGSCLKNNEYYVDLSKYDASIELPLAANFGNVPGPVALPAQPDQEFHVVVNVASVKPLDKDVNATIALDEEWLDQYNSEQDANVKQKQQDYLEEDTSHTVDDDDYPADYVPYELFPDSLYTIDKTDFTVSAGERQAYATLILAMDKMDATRKYVLPFTITSSDLPISSWNHLMMNLQAKNEYDGDYKNTYDGSLGSGENNITLNTVNATTSKMAPGLIGEYTNEEFITVDTTTNKVTVSVPSLAPTVTDPSSHYDPDTQTFYLDFICGGSGQYHFTQTMVKK